MIVAACLEAGVTRMYSEDFARYVMTRFGSRQPFASALAVKCAAAFASAPMGPL